MLCRVIHVQQCSFFIDILLPASYCSYIILVYRYVCTCRYRIGYARHLNVFNCVVLRILRYLDIKIERCYRYHYHGNPIPVHVYDGKYLVFIHILQCPLDVVPTTATKTIRRRRRRRSRKRLVLLIIGTSCDNVSLNSIIS